MVFATAIPRGWTMIGFETASPTSLIGGSRSSKTIRNSTISIRRQIMLATSRRSLSTLQTISGTTTKASSRPLKHLSWPALLRTLFFSKAFASTRVSNAGLSILSKLAHSRAPLLDPDRNRILGRILRAVIYNHFCAGAGRSEIVQTCDGIRRAGAGVIMNYAKEVVAHDMAEVDPAIDVSAVQIEQWLEGNMRSLSFLKRDDYIGVKYTGAGGRIASALQAGEDPPGEFIKALHKLCDQAQAQGTRILLDAEQQAYQCTIDAWTVDLMRKYNRGGDALILNTYQAYLKGARQVLGRHLAIAQREGWTLGVKLVRGAYMLQETRSLIHDSKEETDAAYNSIAEDLLRREFDGINGQNFPSIRLFVAGHNGESIQKVCQLHESLTLAGRGHGLLELGQLMGMADHVTGNLLEQQKHKLAEAEQLPAESASLLRQSIPLVFKVVNWGTVRECLTFLMRRAAENAGAAERLQDGRQEAKRELWARLSMKA